MRQMIGLLLSVLAVSAAPSYAARNLTLSVDTRIGTGGGGYGIGQLNPGAQFPFGCMRLGPDNSIGWEPIRITFDVYGGYYYENDFIECFSHTHTVGAGEGDFQNFGFMVTRQWNEDVVVNAGYKSRYEHTQEVALPGYYAVDLLSSNTYAEVTVSGTHSGMHRYTCRSQLPSPQAMPCVLVLDICHGFMRKFLDMGSACANAQLMTLVTDGQKFKLEAYILDAGDFAHDSSKGGVDIWLYAEVTAKDSSTGAALNLSQGMWLNQSITTQNTFAPTNSGSLGLGFWHPQLDMASVVFEVRSGLSFVSQANAKLNLVAQQQKANGTWMSFDECHQAAANEWEVQLSRVSVSGSLADDPWHRKVFYSSIYRVMMSPSTYSESNGEYTNEAWVVKNAKNGTRWMSDLSIWDVYRTQMPLLGILRPDVARDVANSMMEMYNTTGRLPKWVFANVETNTMVGMHSAIVFADDIMKGIKGIDIPSIVNAISKGILEECASLQQYGYIPLEDNERGSSETLDYAVDAGALVHLGEFLNNPGLIQQFSTFADTYKNVFDNETLYVCPKYKNGTFTCPFPLDPYPFTHHFTEGNAAQYRWYVPHDIAGLVALFPSTDDFANGLDEFFKLSELWPFNTTMPNWSFWAGNEPDILTPVMFNFAGNQYAHLTQYWFPRILDTYYIPYSSGVPGNDDYGTMSAFAFFGYCGLYPVASTELYSLFAPRFDSIDIAVGANDFSASPWSGIVPPSPNGQPTTIVQIRAKGRPSSGTAYVANITLNGVQLTRPIISHTALLATKGGASLLEYQLSATPSVFCAPLPADGGPEPFLPPTNVQLTPQMSEILDRVRAALAEGKTPRIRRERSPTSQHY